MSDSRLRETERLPSTPPLKMELRLWQFTRSLQRVFVELGDGIMYSTRAKDAWEAKNILDRWLLSFQLDHAGRMDPLLPLLPARLRMSDAANQKLMAECVEKKFSRDRRNARRIASALVDAVSDFKKLVPQLAKEAKEFVSFREDPETKEGQVVTANFASPVCHRVWFLVTNFSLYCTARMLLRYETLGTGSLQWGDPVTVHHELYSCMQVRYEGFASPLNSKLLGKKDARFCSLFRDTDAPFGSLGEFFSVDFKEHPGGWTVNPPFIEELMNRVSDKLLRHLGSDASSNWFFVTFPEWRDCDGWAQLDASEFRTERIDLAAERFAVQDCYGNAFCPQNRLTIFVMGSLPCQRSLQLVKDKFLATDLDSVRQHWRRHCAAPAAVNS